MKFRDDLLLQLVVIFCVIPAVVLIAAVCLVNIL